MPISALRSMTRRPLPWIASLTVLVLASFALGVGAGAPIPTGDGEGPWINPVNVNECNQPGQICAEWPNYTEGLAQICCIDASLVGTYQKAPQTCQKYLGIRAF